MVHLPEEESSAESKGTLNIRIQDEDSNGISGVKVKITSKKDNSELESTLSGTLGGCKIENVPYGQYTVSLSITPTGYTAGTIDDITIDNENNLLNITLNSE